MKTLFLDFDEEKIISSLPSTVPLFPLDNVVFFPNTILPLHIFEERYKQMISDSQDSHNLICMALFNSEIENDDSKHNNIIIDKSSLDMLKGSVIDFSEELIGSSFKISNPKTKSSCGCGVSFSF